MKSAILSASIRPLFAHFLPSSHLVHSPLCKNKGRCIHAIYRKWDSRTTCLPPEAFAEPSTLANRRRDGERAGGVPVWRVGTTPCWTPNHSLDFIVAASAAITGKNRKDYWREMQEHLNFFLLRRESLQEAARCEILILAHSPTCGCIRSHLTKMSFQLFINVPPTSPDPATHTHTVTHTHVVNRYRQGRA